eukprot:COSAG05_NODE_446_length_9772_cov_117.012923_2_plen_210_part_00
MAAVRPRPPGSRPSTVAAAQQGPSPAPPLPRSFSRSWLLLSVVFVASTATMLRLRWQHAPQQVLDRGPFPGTIVTAYFDVPSKRSHAQYEEWMANMLSLQDRMIIFTSPDLAPFIKKLRAHAALETIIVPMSIEDRQWPLPIHHENRSFWERELERDPVRRAAALLPAAGHHTCGTAEDPPFRLPPSAFHLPMNAFSDPQLRAPVHGVG